MASRQIAVGIDLGGTNTVFGFVDREGNILGEDRIKTGQYDEIEVYVAALYEKIMVARQKITEDIEIIGFGIGAPMGNINKGTIEYAANLPWKGIVPLADVFRKHTDLPVVVTNDANAAAVGEKLCCHHPGYRSGQRICGQRETVVRARRICRGTGSYIRKARNLEP